MKSSDKLEMVKTILNLTGTDEDGRIGVYLIAAAREILSWRFSYAGSYPSFTERDGVPVGYEMAQLAGVVGEGAEVLLVEAGVGEGAEGEVVGAELFCHWYGLLPLFSPSLVFLAYNL